MRKPKPLSPKPFARVEDQNTANMNTRWNEGRIQTMRRQLAEYDLDAHSSDRVAEGLCKTCYYVRVRGGVSLQAFHYRDCEFCGTEQTFANSDTRKACATCGTNYGVCRNCLGDVEERVREDLVPPKNRQKQIEFWARQSELDSAHKVAVASRQRTSTLTSRMR